jgi:hypothetical protein
MFMTSGQVLLAVQRRLRPSVLPVSVLPVSGSVVVV